MGKLYLVPTPIGNLDDMSFRAVQVLKDVDFVLAEDTRNSGKLLKHFGISTPMFSHHQHNEHKSVAGAIQKIQEGNDLALISDAGTPGISDPGFLLVRNCIEQDIEVECLPGPSAFLPALLLSGLPCDKFHFEGFLPHKKGRQTRIKELAEKECTLILYESPYRIVKLLEQVNEFMGSRRNMSISRELTKVYEETIRGTAQELLEIFKEKNIKGEFVVVIEGKSW
ncbi:MAG: 16S rRNA (cytidine(1402)-2'-O)-methyltransferase [Bacteroidales bacterium]|nr:16S rRNA (cytidine(1402)-2'-O)-methyltransferase [Bacteroidales bacterium]MCF8387727.1 16S rRNA (cytidine(1402)-2'-O)-methyltransferase [Bacteroidales bacterium]MCF8397543.1 16S rRNA (cytidine(1402)-2'-O)-methyltransferase [Bacteroidales bacterium]